MKNKMSKTNSKSPRKGTRYVEKINNIMWAIVKHIVASLDEEDFDSNFF
jgi:hypothetical protein